VGAAKGSLANAVGSMYVQKYFKEDAKRAALDMVADIRTEFNKILDEVNRLSSSKEKKLICCALRSIGWTRARRRGPRPRPRAS